MKKSVIYFDDEQKCWTAFTCDGCDAAALKAELDAAVADLARGHDCQYCASHGGCVYPPYVDVSAEMCEACNRCPCGHCDGVSQWKWRGRKEDLT